MKSWEHVITVRLRSTRNFLSVAIIKQLIIESATKIRYRRPFMVSVSMVNARAIQRMNRVYRGKDEPTNVLAFPATGGHNKTEPSNEEGDLGDIFLCPSVIRKEASQFMMTVKQHAARLVVHGFLHLVGYDHKRNAEATRMERLEKQILDSVV